MVAGVVDADVYDLEAELDVESKWMVDASEEKLVHSDNAVTI